MSDEWDDETDFDESWSDDSIDLIECPACGAEIYEEAQQCPRCGEYVTHTGGVWQGRPGWWVILGMLGVFAAIIALLQMG